MWNKFRRTHIIICLLFSFNFMSNDSYAMTAQEQFRIGIESAKKGDYRSARRQFELALQLGLDSAALRYNLAVSFYKLELYPQAYDNFLTLIDHPNLGAVAAYNLGLTTEKQRLLDEAKRWYTRVNSSATDKNLLDLSDRALRFLNGQTFVEKRRKRSVSTKLWRGKLSLKLSYDDNLNRTDDSKQLAKGSELDLTGSGYLTGNSRNGWKLFGRLYRLDYVPREYEDSANVVKNTDESNSSYTEIAGSYHFKKSLWRYRATAIVSSTVLGTQSVDKTHQSARSFEIQTERHVVKLVKLRFRYRYQDISSSDFDNIVGNKELLRMDVQVANGRSKKSGKKVRFSYIYELNDRLDDNYSPQRTWFRFSIESPISISTKMNVVIEHRSSTYDHYRVVATSNGDVRNDDRLRLRLELNYKYTGEWRFTAGVMHNRNESDVINGTNSNDFDYSQTVLYSALRWYY